MLAVPAAAAALLHPVAFRQNKRRFAHNIRNRLEPWRMQDRGIDGDAALVQNALAVVDRKHLAGKSPQIIDRGLRTAMAFLGAVAEPHDPLRRMPQMIGAL